MNLKESTKAMAAHAQSNDDIYPCEELTHADMNLIWSTPSELDFNSTDQSVPGDSIISEA